MQCQIDGLSERPAKARGALFGLTVGVKDLFDTADSPTAYVASESSATRPRAGIGSAALIVYRLVTRGRSDDTTDYQFGNANT